MNTATELLSDTLARRMAEIDSTLDLAPGNWLAECYLSDLLDQIMDGQFEIVTDGWRFDDGKQWACNRLRELVGKWKAEDARTAGV